MDDVAVADIAPVERAFVPGIKFAPRVVGQRGYDFDLVAEFLQFSGKGLESCLRTADFGWKMLCQYEKSHRDMN